MHNHVRITRMIKEAGNVPGLFGINRILYFHAIKIKIKNKCLALFFIFLGTTLSLFCCDDNTIIDIDERTLLNIVYRADTPPSFSRHEAIQKDLSATLRYFVGAGIATLAGR